VIGDISRYGGGPLDQHVSHQTPRRRRLLPAHRQLEVAPTSVDQVDIRSRATAAPLRSGKCGVLFVARIFVERRRHRRPLTGHDNHMHVRIFP